MTGQLTPARCHQEADEGDPEADQDVPGGEGRNRQLALADVENNDPDQAEKHEPEHHWLEPHRVGCLFAGAGCLVACGLGAGIRTCHARDSTVIDLTTR